VSSVASVRAFSAKNVIGGKEKYFAGPIFSGNFLHKACAQARGRLL